MTVALEAEPKLMAIKSRKNKMSISTSAGAIIIKSRKRAYVVLIHHRLIMGGKGQIIKTGMEDNSSPKKTENRSGMDNSSPGWIYEYDWQ